MSRIKSLINYIIRFIYWIIFKRIYKFLVRLFTKTHEIERAINKKDFKHFFKSFIYSEVFNKKNLPDSISQMINLLRAVDQSKILCKDVLKEPYYERIKKADNIVDYYIKEKKILNMSNVINTYYNKNITILFYLKVFLNDKTSIIFNEKNEAHCNMLEELFNETFIKMSKHLNYKEKKYIGIVSPDWLKIGFQAKNPDTDLRSTGIFGLEQLLHFCKNSEYFDKVFITSTDEQKWYFFAAAGINITGAICEYMTNFKSNEILYQLLNKDSLIQNKSLLFNPLDSEKYMMEYKKKINIELTENKVDNSNLAVVFSIESLFIKYLNQLYERLFYEFNCDWLKQTSFNFMNFNTRFDIFIKTRLKLISNDVIVKL